ncbi:unnamed protein product [Caenorhabditis sp. 36 PRJEB53466]|nr:unnamed protein product [Caenorhabditis sp. 36 PRJEB53466]
MNSEPGSSSSGLQKELPSLEHEPSQEREQPESRRIKAEKTDRERVITGIKSENTNSQVATEGKKQQQAELECPNVETLVLFNETYFEIIDQSLALVDQQLADNRAKQKQLTEEYRLYSRADVQKRKVPVHLYMPPYFKDENGMCPPMSAEAREKQELKWFDPLMKEEKKWTAHEIKTLRDAVKEAMIAHQMQPLCSRRDIIVGKLRNTDVTTTGWERRQWTMELEDLMRKIAYIKAKTEEEVLTASADYSVVPWNAVANVDFKGTRTEWAVKSKWNNELNPKWSKASWTTTEVEQLRALRESPKFVSWPLLALTLGTQRTAYQCMEKYKTDVAQHSREWTQDEDAKLIALTKLTSINGHIQWDKVAQFMPGRTRQQVRTRFSHTLDASVKHGRWTDQEDMLLMCAVSRHGAKDWAKVAQAVQNRNDSQCRERWSNVLNRSAHVSERFTLAEDEQLLYAVKVFGKGNWAKCQTLLPKKTSRQLRRRYIQLIAAKLRLVAGFCNAVDAMKSGRRDPAEDELDEEDELESAKIPNELMIEIYEKLSKERPDVNETPEEFFRRVNEIEEPVAARVRTLKNRPDYELIRTTIKKIVSKNQANGSDIDLEVRASKVLSSLRITEVDVRYMIERSKTLSRYYQARQFRRNVDQIGCRVRPVSIDMDASMLPKFEQDCGETEKVMRLVESLCISVRKHDVVQWGKKFWTDHRHTAAREAKRFVQMMINQRAPLVAEFRLSQDSGESCPVKTTLPPSIASFDLLKMLTKAREGLHKLSAEHFFPVDVSLEDQPNFTNEEREKLTETRRMNIQLSEQITKGTEFSLFYARMRAILLEPMRLQVALESADEERDRLRQEIDSETRITEEEGVVEGVLRRPEMPDIAATPSSICRILSDGIHIDTSFMFTNLQKSLVEKIQMKRRVVDVVENVAKRVRRSSRHVSIDSERDDEQN